MSSQEEQQEILVKRQRTSNAWLRSWAWKREHRPDKVRFDRPYMHPFRGEQLTIHQARFKEQGFASTVWDSSIVLAKYLEKNAARYAAARCLDLSAGCGLPGIVLAKLGAKVTATDLGPNLVLLEKNAKANGGLVCSPEPRGQGAHLGRRRGSACAALCGGVRLRRDVHLRGRGAAGGVAGGVVGAWHGSPHSARQESAGRTGVHAGRQEVLQRGEDLQ